MSTALTAANSAWECVDSRVWDASATAMCVSAGSRMFWSMLINSLLGRLEAGAGTEEKQQGKWGGVGGRERAQGELTPRMRGGGGVGEAAVVFSADLTGCARLGVAPSTNHLMPINMKNRSRDTV